MNHRTRTSAVVAVSGWMAALSAGCAAPVESADEDTVEANAQPLSTPNSAEFVSIQAQDITVAKSADQGKLAVFARDIYNHVYVIKQQFANGSWSSYWSPVAANAFFANGSWGPFSMTSPSAASYRPDGSIEIVGRGPNGEICSSFEVPSNGYRFDNWWCLSGPNGAPISDPTIAHYQDGRLVVFVRTASGFFYRTQPHPYTGWGDGWNNWEYFGGSPSSRATLISDVWGRVHAYWRQTDGKVIHAFQGVPNGDNWSVPEVLGGYIQGDPVVANNQDGRMEVFAVGRDGTIYQNWQNIPYPFGYWSGWHQMQNSPSGFSGLAAAANSFDGRLEVFGYDTQNGYIASLAQTVANGGWGTWNWLMDTAGGTPAVGTNADGRLEVFAPESGTRNVAHRWQVYPGNWYTVPPIN